VGTAEVGARIVARDPTAERPFAARVVLDQPVLLRAGDRFVVRSTAPLNTIAGGVVTDPYAPRRARPWTAQLDVAERLQRMLEEASGHGVEAASLPVRLGVSPKSARLLVDSLVADGTAVVAGGVLVAGPLIARLRGEALAAVESFHAEHPLEPGISGSLLRSRLRAAPVVVERVLSDLSSAGSVIGTVGTIARKGWAPNLSGQDAVRAENVLQALGAAGVEPPSVEELAAEIGGDVAGMLRFLERRGDVVQVEDNRYYKAEHLKSLIERLRTAMAGGLESSPAQIRDALELSRKYLIPFLEYCDRVGYTNRSPNGRVWRGT
jgi:selenocysteine-specific elongation factor